LPHGTVLAEAAMAPKLIRVPVGQTKSVPAFVFYVAMAASASLYLASAIHSASQTPFWMDEVLTYIVATQPSMAEVWRAIWTGTDFSPPTFHWLLHGFPGLESHALIVARLPGIMGFLAAALCMAGIVRRQTGLPWASLAFAITLASPMFAFAIQARQYGLLAFSVALALWLWSGLPAHPRTRPIAGIWAALALALCLHFYGIVLVGAVVLCEGLWSWRNRAVRRPVWVALAGLVPVFLVWFPLAHHLRTISAADQIGLGFYGRPTLARLVATCAQLFIGGQPQGPVYFGIAVAVAVGATLRRQEKQASPPPPSQANIVLIGLAAIPIGAFALAVLATGSFMPRYASAAGLLAGPALGLWLGRRHYPDWMALLPLPFVALSLVMQTQSHKRGPIIAAAAQAIVDTPANMPVVTGDGQLYLELLAALPPAQNRRLAYLAGPTPDHSPDPTNEHEVLRLATIEPRIRVVSFAQATAAGQRLNILHTRPGQIDMAKAAIANWHLPAASIAENSIARIDQVEIPSQTGPAPKGKIVK